LVGFLTAAEFAKHQFGDDSELYRNLSQEAELFLRKANLIKPYHTRLQRLYASVRHDHMSTTAALAEKRRIFEELGKECREITPEPKSFNRCPATLNNAGLAFDMTYTNYYPQVYEMYVRVRNLSRMIDALKQVSAARK